MCSSLETTYLENRIVSSVLVLGVRFRLQSRSRCLGLGLQGPVSFNLNATQTTNRKCSAASVRCDAYDVLGGVSDGRRRRCGGGLSVEVNGGCWLGDVVERSDVVQCGAAHRRPYDTAVRGADCRRRPMPSCSPRCRQPPSVIYDRCYPPGRCSLPPAALRRLRPVLPAWKVLYAAGRPPSSTPGATRLPACRATL